MMNQEKNCHFMLLFRKNHLNTTKQNLKVSATMKSSDIQIDLSLN